MTGFADWLTVTASTKRNPAQSGGKVGEPETSLTSLAVMPLMPLDAETREMVPLSSPRTSWQTFCRDADVIEGDRLVIGDSEYIVRSVAMWPWERVTGGQFLHIIVEETK